MTSCSATVAPQINHGLISSALFAQNFKGFIYFKIIWWSFIESGIPNRILELRFFWQKEWTNRFTSKEPKTQTRTLFSDDSDCEFFPLKFKFSWYFYCVAYVSFVSFRSITAFLIFRTELNLAPNFCEIIKDSSISKMLRPSKPAMLTLFNKNLHAALFTLFRIFLRFTMP